jgi:hypothetical protein
LYAINTYYRETWNNAPYDLECPVDYVTHTSQNDIRKDQQLMAINKSWIENSCLEGDKLVANRGVVGIYFCSDYKNDKPGKHTCKARLNPPFSSGSK